MLEWLRIANIFDSPLLEFGSFNFVVEYACSSKSGIEFELILELYNIFSLFVVPAFWQFVCTSCILVKILSCVLIITW